jgi:hypothetical protein
VKSRRALQTAVLALIGATIFAACLLSAFSGLLTNRDDLRTNRPEGPAEDSLLRFRLPDLASFAARGVLIHGIVDRSRGREELIHPAGETGHEVVLRAPCNAQGDYWLSCSTEGQKCEFRFQRQDPGRADANVVYALAMGPEWDFADAQLERWERRWHLTGSDDRIVPSSVGENDRIGVEDSWGNQLARARFLKRQRSFPIPVSRRGIFTYRLHRACGAGVAARLEYIACRRSLLLPVFLPPAANAVFVDEVTTRKLYEGSIIRADDLATHEPLALGYLPRSDSSESEYYLNPVTAAADRVILRPLYIPFSFRATDQLSRQPVKEIAVQVTGGAVHDRQGRRLLLPSPREVPNLGSVRLVVSSPGYESRSLSLESVGEFLGRADGEIEVQLKRTLCNIVVIWPASIGVGRVLGRNKFVTPAPFLCALQKELLPRCEPLGYGSVDIFILKDDGLRDFDPSTPMTYHAADRLEAILDGCEGAPGCRSVYDDANFQNRFGRHTFVVAFLGDTYPAPGIRRTRRRVLHLHLVKLWREVDDDESGIFRRFCAANSDAVTHLVVGNVQKMTEKAGVLAADVETELRRHLSPGGASARIPAAASQSCSSTTSR